MGTVLEDEAGFVVLEVAILEAAALGVVAVPDDLLTAVFGFATVFAGADGATVPTTGLFFTSATGVFAALAVVVLLTGDVAVLATVFLVAAVAAEEVVEIVFFAAVVFGTAALAAVVLTVVVFGVATLTVAVVEAHREQSRIDCRWFWRYETRGCLRASERRGCDDMVIAGCGCREESGRWDPRSIGVCVSLESSWVFPTTTRRAIELRTQAGLASGRDGDREPIEVDVVRPVPLRINLAKLATTSEVGKPPSAMLP